MRKTALDYLRKGYLWNSGNFLFRSDVMIAEFRKYAPAILDAAEAAVVKASDDLGFVRLDQESFEKSRRTRSTMR